MRNPVAVALASTALMLAAAAPLLITTLTGPNSQFVPEGQALAGRQLLRRSELPARPGRGGDGDRRRPGAPGSTRLVPPPDRRSARESSAAPRSPRRRVAASSTRTSPSPNRRSRPPRPGRGPRDPRPPSAGGDAGPGLRQHRRLHRPEAEPDRTRATGRRDRRRRHPADPLPPHRLGDPAAEDAADERADPGRDAGDRRHRLPGRGARRPLRLPRARRPSRSPAWSSSSRSSSASRPTTRCW